jgi:hypothetical protein
MKGLLYPALCLVAFALLPGCETVPPGVEQGPGGTIAYEVSLEASPPGAQIEANGKVLGNAPLRLKIFGDKDGTFHDFGSYYYVIRALPLATNQFVQTRVFRTGRWFTPEDHIPQRIYFDMSQNQPPYPVADPGLPVYGYPPYYYYPPVYHGPPMYFYYGPHYYRHW